MKGIRVGDALAFFFICLAASLSHILHHVYSKLARNKEEDTKKDTVEATDGEREVIQSQIDKIVR